MASSGVAFTKNEEKFKKEVAAQYDQMYDDDKTWDTEYMHLGFYDPGQTNVPLEQAQARVIEEALSFASISEEPAKKPRTILDVGCGIGGSSRLFAKRYGATVTGFTISPVEIQVAKNITNAQGLADKVSFQVGDAMNQPFPDGKFDMVWSLESAEHMTDKAKFISELARVTAPGGTIILVTMCHRDLSPSEKSLLPKEKELLNKIAKTYHIAGWCSGADYVSLFRSNNIQDIKVADWSENVKPFWPAFFKSALTWKGILTILCCGWKTLKFALAATLMIEGYKNGLVRYNIIVCKKPE